MLVDDISHEIRDNVYIGINVNNVNRNENVINNINNVKSNDKDINNVNSNVNSINSDNNMYDNDLTFNKCTIKLDNIPPEQRPITAYNLRELGDGNRLNINKCNSKKCTEFYPRFRRIWQSV